MSNECNYFLHPLRIDKCERTHIILFKNLALYSTYLIINLNDATFIFPSQSQRFLVTERVSVRIFTLQVPH